jgi:1-phosphatidylinositol-3-phosphate 5-kinase
MTSRRRHSGSLTEPNSGTATPVPSDFMFTTASNPSAMISANSKRSQQPTTGASQSPPDPDVASSWNEEPEECSTVITRKEHPRDVSSLLGLRDIIRHKDSSDNPRSGSVMSSVSKLVSSKTPPSAWTKPNVEVSLQAADGRVTATSTDEALSDQVIRALSLPTPTTEHESEDATVATSSILSSLSSQGSTIVPEPSTIKTTQATQPDDTRSKSMPELPTETADNSDTSGFKQASLPPESPHASAATGSISIALANAMRFILNSGPDDQPKAAKERGRLDLLASDPDSVYNSIDERPHIKYDWTMGKRLKFNCTAYFAKEFEFLRQRCNTQEVLLRSLRKSQNWNAEGGKSKSNFFKTHDDRFIIKTLVNAWNVADLYVP